MDTKSIMLIIGILLVGGSVLGVLAFIVYWFAFRKKKCDGECDKCDDKEMCNDSEDCSWNEESETCSSTKTEPPNTCVGECTKCESQTSCKNSSNCEWYNGNCRQQKKVPVMVIVSHVIPNLCVVKQLIVMVK